MPTITYKKTPVSIVAPETVLDGLNQAGLSIPFSCKKGLCHSCLMQADSKPPITSQHGLSDNQKSQNLFLACSCIPSTDMSVNLVGDTNKGVGTVRDKKPLNETVLAVFIQTDFRWFPGQHVTLWLDDYQGRSYSIASLCDQNRIIELHIKRHQAGVVSTWIHDTLKIGDRVSISKPTGNCFYNEDHEDKSILMVSTGTGLAPIMGILKEALKNNHAGDIYLYVATGEPSSLYYQDKLKEIANNNENVYYVPVVRRNAAGDKNLIQSDIADLIEERHKNLFGWKIFLCGNESMIKKVQRYCFFQGAKVHDILTDAFIVSIPSK